MKIKDLLFYIFFKMFASSGERVIGEVLSYIQRYDKNHFLTFHLRPKHAVDINYRSANEIPPYKLAIIIQGPLVIEDNFTVETIALYNKTFKGAKLILSTWEGEDEVAIEKVKKLGVEVIISELPKTRNHKNIDYMLKSTICGLKLSNELKYEYSMRTRTDHRFYRNDIFDYFISLLNTFPLANKSKQNNRIISTSFNTFKYRIYSITDTMMFGDTKDLLNYWSADYYDDGIKPYLNNESEMNPTVGGQKIINEIYLLIKYLEKLGIEPEWSLEHYWMICRDYFCFVDSTALDFYWPKWEKYNEYRFSGEKIKSYTKILRENIEFGDWLQLFMNKSSSVTKWQETFTKARL